MYLAIAQHSAYFGQLTGTVKCRRFEARVDFPVSFLYTYKFESRNVSQAILELSYFRKIHVLKLAARDTIIGKLSVLLAYLATLCV